MNIEDKLEKIINIMQIDDIEQIPEVIKTLETYYNLPLSDSLSAFVPTEANFQLPNVFLRTKKLPECEKFILKNHSSKLSLKFEEIIKFLEGVEIESEYFSSKGESVECDMNFMRKCIEKRY